MVIIHDACRPCGPLTSVPVARYINIMILIIGAHNVTLDLWSVLHNARLMYTTYVQHAHNQHKVMPSYSNLWEARIANLCRLPLIQTQRCPAPPTPVVLSTTTISCSPPHLETTLWRALCLPTTSPSETSSQSTTCPMEKPSNGSMLRSGGLKVRLAQGNCVGEFKGKGRWQSLW